MEKAVPKYQQIRNLIQQEIRHGRYRPGSPFLSLLELSDEYGVSNITARRIVRELEEADYLECRKGNRPVVRLPQQDIPRLRKNVGLLVTSTEFEYRTGPWAYTILARLQKLIFEHGNSSMLFSLKGNWQQQLDFCDALVMTQPFLPPEQIEVIRKRKIPFVGIASYLPEPRENFIGLDFADAGQAVGRSILKFGMKHIIGVLQPNYQRDWLTGRFGAMWTELEAGGISRYQTLFHEAAITEEDGEALFRRLAAAGLPEKCVFLTLSDFTAIGICRAALSAGLQPQRDFMVLGSAGLPEAISNTPPISSFVYPTAELTDRAIEMLYGQINDRVSRCPGEFLPVSYSERST